ncbi:hypothetical protein L7F22_014515 [Adiantum nelumboides]|nr:hypothetical protein [Adiantum nelumboides]
MAYSSNVQQFFSGPRSLERQLMRAEGKIAASIGNLLWNCMLFTKRYRLIFCALGTSGRTCYRFKPLRLTRNFAPHFSDEIAWRPCVSKYRGIFHTRAMTSSAEANEGNLEGHSEEKDLKYYMDNMSLVLEEDGVNGGHAVEGKPGSKGSMAEAFNISPRTAFGITAVVALAGLLLPLTMNSVTASLTLKTKVLSYATLLCGFYMARNIGANDVANAMGTSVDSGALTLRQAVLIAAGLEFSGAFLVGAHVSHTMQKGILTPETFVGKSTLLFSGMLSSLAAAGTWLQLCRCLMQVMVT